MGKGTHVIERYSVAQKRITCVCGWEGHEDDFTKHRTTAPPTDKVVVTGYERNFQAHRKVTTEDAVRGEYITTITE